MEPNKKDLREKCLKIRNQLSSEERASASAAICQRILQLEQYRAATRVAIYHAMEREINLGSLRSNNHKTWYFPVIKTDQTLSFVPVDDKTIFHKSYLGIMEPNVNPGLAIRADQLDIIFIPLVAFDEHGSRLGMGAGYYDRTLAEYRPKLLLGAAYEFQRQPFIPADSWDIPLTGIITEKTIYWSKP